MDARWMVYGATGYTGRLVATHARARGQAPLLAGRSAEKLRAVAGPLDLETRAVGLDDAAALRRALEDVACVLHVAGPFSATAEPMLQACLATATHYLDVTGEIDVFERVASLDGRAREAGCALLPGVGFDVVPSDCLAAHVASRVADPRILRLAIEGLGTPSRGTLKTALESLGEGVRVRRGGRIVSLPAGGLEREFDFGDGPRRCVAMPWGDVATAWHSTGIPDIEVYFRAAGPVSALVGAQRWLGPLLRSGPARRALRALVDRGREGPSDRERETTRGRLVAEVESAGGERARARLETPSGYRLTYLSAVECALRVARGELAPGFHTPSRAFGPDFVLTLPGCTRHDA